MGLRRVSGLVDNRGPSRLRHGRRSYGTVSALPSTPHGVPAHVSSHQGQCHLITKALGNRVEKTDEKKVEWLGLVRSFSWMMCSKTINSHNRFERPIQARGRERNEALPREKPCAFPVIGTVAQGSRILS